MPGLILDVREELVERFGFLVGFDKDGSVIVGWVGDDGVGVAMGSNADIDWVGAKCLEQMGSVPVLDRWPVCGGASDYKGAVFGYVAHEL